MSGALRETCKRIVLHFIGKEADDPAEYLARVAIAHADGWITDAERAELERLCEMERAA